MTLRSLFFSALFGLVATASHALTAEQVRAMAIGENDARASAIGLVAASGDDKAPAFFQALLDDAVKTSGDKVFVVKDGKAVDAATGAAVTLPENAEDVVNSNRMRREIEAALASMKLLSTDASQRAAAIKELREGVDESKLPLIEKAYAAETDAKLKSDLGLLRAGVLISSTDKAKRLEAAKSLADSREPATKTLLLDRLKPDAETEADVRAQLQTSLSAIESRLAWGERLGVINMAHGELMMIGAYATYVVQNLFKAHLPGLFDYYVVAAIPVAFLASALVGAAMERSVIRFLYGRPLETLLATWGISLVLMQAVRSLFGAQNVQVENPSWLSGGVQALSNLTLPFNRIAIIVFAALVLAALAFLVAKTRLGLFVRGVTQNRPMAACMGVNTARVDTYAFALGSGIAGLAGCALSQVGNVGPDLGQGYIVDSFMVVVLGGVGQLAGTVYAALGLGILNKLLEGWTGAVLAKIMVLVFIVVFIQKRPQGLFAMKGRSAEA
jgi:urea transport system permease protein